MNDKITIKGTIENIIYKNSENGYSIFSIFSENYGHIFYDAEITCVGHIHNIKVGDTIEVTGYVTNHNQHGKQLKIENFKLSIPETEKGIEKYLSSGIIKGIGKNIAKRIVKTFGTNTIETIENNPKELCKIKGISLKKAMEINKEFTKEIELRNCILILQNYNVSTNYAIKIYNHFKENTIEIIKTNPYKISDEISGITFNTSDLIAQGMGIKKDSPYRVKASIKYILNKNAIAKGNVYLPEDTLLNEVYQLLKIDLDIIKNYLLELSIEKQVRIENSDEKNIIFLNSYFYAENYTAKKILELSLTKEKINKDYELEIKEIEKNENIVFAKEQKEAIKEAMSNGVLIINGGPGTGKTKTINAIISILKKQGYRLELAAPTGRAAKRMTETTGVEAQTIHKLLGINYLSQNSRKQTFERNESCPIDADVIIVDECSMIDIILMHHLLKAIEIGTRVILIGDINQLPSVGAGNVLKDIINSNLLKVVSLTKIFRQAQESAIIMNAHKINNGEYPILNIKNKDFFFIEKINQEDACNTISDLVINRLPKYLNYTHSKNIQVLSPMKKGILGTKNLNYKLQCVLNPPSKGKQEKNSRDIIFREGDKVMQIKNNYNIEWEWENEKEDKVKGIGIFNGDEGIIKEINLKYEYLKIIFDDKKLVKYDFNQLDELDLSYAITVHKSQGSEYEAVVIPIHTGNSALFSRNLLYTAITRAKSLIVLVGLKSTIFKMVDNNKEINRYTYLKNRIINMYEFIS